VTWCIGHMLEQSNRSVNHALQNHSPNP
jgi:hypothetical protein